MKNIVLVIEDSRAFALSVEQAILQDSSFDVLLAFDYAQACRLLDIYRDDIFVAVADLNLPDAEDGAAAKLMNENGIPCVAFTGNFSASLREKIFKLGVSDYALKNGEQDIYDVVKIIQRLSDNRNINVLVVDDSGSTRELVSALLVKQCFQATAVESAQAALELLRQGKRFKIILVDIVMEGMDGFQLLRELRANYDASQMSIIGISGKSNSSDVAKFMKYGGNDFLLKPIQQEQLSCRVNANAQLLDQFDKLNLLNKQKNELLGMAAHDIRGPLGIVISGCGMLKKQMANKEAGLLIDLMAESANDMEELLNQLLDFSAVESASISICKTRFNLSLLLEQTVQSMQLLAKSKEQRLVMDPIMEPAWVEADSVRIKEVIQNLISNAIKYSEKGGYIEVCLSSKHEKVRIEVIDEAGGIPEKEQKSLFQAFSKISTKPTDGERSNGLGLSICQRIMKLHDGSIKYRSNRQMGSIFEIILSSCDE